MHKVLIYRLGSLGDTVVALPLFRLVRRSFGESEITLLTTRTTDPRTISAQAILDNTGLVDAYIDYSAGLRSPQAIAGLSRQVKALNPDILIYMAEPRGLINTIRDALFFRLCGIKTMIGVPYWASRRKHRWKPARGRYEHETERLARCLEDIGDVHLGSRDDWELSLSDDEIRNAERLLRQGGIDREYITCGLGTKVKSKDWGVTNWQELTARLVEKYAGYNLVFIGAEREYEYCDSVGKFWKGRKINICGMTSPRETAAIIKNARMYIGHDSGPMHLAAAQGVPVVAVFSSRAKPGIWFPYGDQHKVLYHRIKCQGCLLDSCPRNNECIRSITVNQAFLRIAEVLDAR